MKPLLMLLGVVVVASHTIAQSEGQREQTDAVGRPVVWRDPGPLAAKDLYWGPGSAERAPQTPFTFVEEDTGGTKPKVVVTDANGATWSVKFAGRFPKDNEVHAEIAATRLAWAFGYFVEEHYYVPAGLIENAKNLRRAADVIDARGTFRVARFERRPPEVRRTGHHWTLDDNPFKDTQELSGLQLVLALVNNWDTKSSNLSIFQVTTPEGAVEDQYLVSDWGSSFGRMGPMALLASRNRWSLEDYQQEEFVEGVDDESVNINHKGDVTIHKVPLAHARWFAQMSSQLPTEQVRRAFEASGASADEASGFAMRVMQKLDELHTAVRTAGE